MKERPILFSGAMVRAILENRKTQTRRVLKQPNRRDGVKLVPELLQKIGVGHASPYGVPGDRLWVRETWQVNTPPSGYIYRADCLDYENGDEGCRWRPSIFMPRKASRILLDVANVRVERVQDITAADCIAEGVQYPVSSEGCPKGQVRPLINISAKHSPLKYLPREYTHNDLLRAHYAALWDSINAARGFAWERNPWVWVVEFRRIEA
jgi:hypothetical protein